MATWAALAPAAFGVLGAVAAMLLDAWGQRRPAAVVAGLLLLAGATWAGAATVTGPMVVVGPVRAGLLASLAPAACLLLGSLALLGGVRVLTQMAAGGRLAALAALAAAASATAAASSDLVLLLIAIETLALCGFGLVALAGTDRSREASMKWFVQSAVATAVFVMGVAVLISAAGRTGAALAASSAVGTALVVSALAFKAGAFPLHSWAPDAYETAPPVAAALLASAGKIAALVALAWTATVGAGASSPALSGWVVALLATGSITFGNLAALRQRSFVRMLAYSGIAQVGYALVGVSSSLGRVPSGGAVQGTAAVVLFSVLYGLAALGSFMFVAAVREKDPGWDGDIAGLAGLARRRPRLAAALAVFMFSLTGIPLTGGFWGKFLVFGAAVTSGWTWLALLGVVGSVVSFGYYGRVLRAAYLEDEAEPMHLAEAPTPFMGPGPATGATIAVAVAVVLLGVTPLLAGLAPLVRALSGTL